MAQAQVYAGTPEELAKFLHRLPHAKMYTMVVTPEEEKTVQPVDTTALLKQVRLATIDAAMGSLAHVGVSVEDLHREKQADNALSEHQIQRK